MPIDLGPAFWRGTPDYDRAESPDEFDRHDPDVTQPPAALRPVEGVAYCTTCRGSEFHEKWCQTIDGRGSVPAATNEEAP